MLRDILSRMDDEEFLHLEIEGMKKSIIRFSEPARKLLARSPHLKEFIDILRIRANGNQDIPLGAYVALTLVIHRIKSNREFDRWFTHAVKTMGASFCLAQADLLLRSGGDSIAWDFTAKIRDYFNESLSGLDMVLAVLALKHGTGLLVGAYTILELLRRREEGDFGPMVTDRLQ